ncbi:hypothetical protein TNCV_2538251 [Trichonephila clavipes]|nr:hypothetical protein TNCV_2538251 [Trichonephila clavipes]
MKIHRLLSEANSKPWMHKASDKPTTAPSRLVKKIDSSHVVRLCETGHVVNVEMGHPRAHASQIAQYFFIWESLFNDFVFGSDEDATSKTTSVKGCVVADRLDQHTRSAAPLDQLWSSTMSITSHYVLESEAARFQRKSQL